LGKVECCFLPGLDLFFYSDDHGPPHVHVRSQGRWEIRVDLVLTTKDDLVFSVKWQRDLVGPRRRIQRALCRVVTTYRGALLNEWNQKVISD
jgi:uncharacterized protein DUF4160